MSLKNRFFIISLFLVLTIFFAWRITLLKISPNWWEFLPEGSQTYKDYISIIEKFDFAGTLMVVIEGESQDELINFTNYLSPKLEKLKFVRSVGFGDKQIQKQIRKHALLFLEIEELKDLKEHLKANKRLFAKILKNPYPENFLKIINDEVEERGRGGDKRLKTIKVLKPLKEVSESILSFLSLLKNALSGGEYNIGDFFESWLIGERNRGEGGKIHSKYLISQDGKMLLMPIAFSEDIYSSIEYEIKVVKEIEKILQKAGEELKEGKEVESEQKIKVNLTGGAVIDKEGDEAIKRTLNFTTPLAVLGVVALFIISFKSLVPLLSFIPLVMGIIGF